MKCAPAKNRVLLERLPQMLAEARHASPVQRSDDDTVTICHTD